MKVLISGHKGFIGSYFVESYKDHDLTLLDIKSGNEAAEYFRLNNDRFDLVFHFAAIVGGRAMFEHEPWRLFNNFNLDSELLQWCLRTRPGKVICFSSSAAYPMSLQEKGSQHKLVESDIDLNNMQSPDPSIYGLSKLNLEHLVEYTRQQGINIATFRPFSGYSEKQSLDYPFPSFIKRGLEKNKEFEIWGDGNQTRDFVHVDDIVACVNEAIKQDFQGSLNICTGVPISFNKLKELICEQIPNYDPPIKHKLDAPVGVYYRVGNPTLMNTLYIPKISVTEGIDRAIRHMI